MIVASLLWQQIQHHQEMGSCKWSMLGKLLLDAAGQAPHAEEDVAWCSTVLSYSHMCHAWCRVLKWLKAFADERGLAWQQDAVGNLVIKRTGSGGGENAPAVVIQVAALSKSQCH